MRNFDNVTEVVYDPLSDTWGAIVEYCTSSDTADDVTSYVSITREDAKAWFTLKISNHEDGILRARSALALFDMREK